MDLKGKLAVFDSTTIFQMLNLAQVTGKLQLTMETNSARIYFEKGNIIFAEITNKSVKLGEYLVNQGLINERQLADALQKKPKNKKLGNILVSDGIIEEAALQTAIEAQIKDVVFEVVRWREGGFTFSTGKKPKSQDIFLDLPTDYLMLEGLKRMDEAGDNP
ncbi:MAG: DUF4388 domain-containing protein [Candidatus Latescibacterota bacterium]